MWLILSNSKYVIIKFNKLFSQLCHSSEIKSLLFKKYENFKQNDSKGMRKSNKSVIYQGRHTFGTTTRFLIPKNGKF